MRPADEEEVMLLSGQQPKEALTQSFEASEIVRTLSYRDQPLIMYGTARAPDNRGIVWGLGTTEIEKHTVPFLRVSRSEVELLQGDFSQIFNLVHHANKLHLQWVKFVGFTLNDPITHPSGELVVPISRSKK